MPSAGLRRYALGEFPEVDRQLVPTLGVSSAVTLQGNNLLYLHNNTHEWQGASAHRV